MFTSSSSSWMNPYLNPYYSMPCARDFVAAMVEQSCGPRLREDVAFAAPASPSPPDVAKGIGFVRLDSEQSTAASDGQPGSDAAPEPDCHAADADEDPSFAASEPADDLDAFPLALHWDAARRPPALALQLAVDDASSQQLIAVARDGT
eukprot:CAMPEP_0198603126 /NCGR_PEP_ID=MMETSP1462-20131121/151576_1 /TAXON_ID=1333877 /ORGANISM="Brandtodinium nutriculum, Strain RCC3387" /LENGTH=148 /DNA_ID=CAMNT_0044334895 /DNA_START=15 /DNA_END=457 /DNA_ORIENTATION=-